MYIKLYYIKIKKTIRHSKDFFHGKRSVTVEVVDRLSTNDFLFLLSS